MWNTSIESRRVILLAFHRTYSTRQSIWPVLVNLRFNDWSILKFRENRFMIVSHTIFQDQLNEWFRGTLQNRRKNRWSNDEKWKNKNWKSLRLIFLSAFLYANIYITLAVIIFQIVVISLSSSKINALWKNTTIAIFQWETLSYGLNCSVCRSEQFNFRSCSTSKVVSGRRLWAFSYIPSLHRPTFFPSYETSHNRFWESKC